MTSEDRDSHTDGIHSGEAMLGWTCDVGALSGHRVYRMRTLFTMDMRTGYETVQAERAAEASAT